MFLDLYIFADRYRISGMKEKVIECLRRSLWVPDLDIIVAVFNPVENLPDSKSIEEILVERYISRGGGPQNQRAFDQLPRAFAFQVMNKMFKTIKQK